MQEPSACTFDEAASKRKLFLKDHRAERFAVLEPITFSADGVRVPLSQ